MVATSAGDRRQRIVAEAATPRFAGSVPSTTRRCLGTWWAPPPSKRLGRAIPVRRVRFPSTSAKIDVIDVHRPLHDTDALTPEFFDRWLEIFHDIIDDGWTGPHAVRAKKRATGMAWAMANDSSAMEPGDPPNTGDPAEPLQPIALEGIQPVLTYVTADINCPTCFNQVIETITATSGVHSVDPRITDGCIAITHDLDESVLIATITTIGHTIDIAPNGEITMGQAHAATIHACEHH